MPKVPMNLDLKSHSFRPLAKASPFHKNYISEVLRLMVVSPQCCCRCRCHCRRRRHRRHRHHQHIAMAMERPLLPPLLLPPPLLPPPPPPPSSSPPLSLSSTLLVCN